MANKNDDRLHHNAIIFDDAFESSFMYHALHDGFVVPPDPSGEELWDKALKDMMTRYRRAKKRTEVLELSLIYEHVFLYSFSDEFDFRKLVSEQLVSTIDPIDPSTYHKQRNMADSEPYLHPDDAQLCRLLKPIILPYLKRKAWRMNSTFYDLSIDLLSSSEFRSTALNGTISRRTILDFLKLPHFHEFKETARRILASGTNEQQKEVQEIMEQELGATFWNVLAVYDDMLRALHLLETASQSHHHIASQLLKPLSSKTPHALLLEPLDEQSVKYGVFRLIVDEVEYFPVLTSLSDVLRLREDKRILDFRNNLTRWAQAIISDNELDASEEEKLRREIRKSNRALRSLTPWKQADRWITYAALPLTIIPFLGLPLSIMGAAIQLHVDLVEHQNRWLMIGR